MLYIKSFLAGLLSMIAAAVAVPLIVIVGAIIDTVLHARPGSGSIGWDPVSLIRQSPFWPITFFVACFCGGFYWEYHRVAK
jgi:hypothetical protein